MDGWMDGWMADCWYLPSCYNDLKYANIVNRRRSSTITHVCLRYACLICQPPPTAVHLWQYNIIIVGRHRVALSKMPNQALRNCE